MPPTMGVAMGLITSLPVMDGLAQDSSLIAPPLTSPAEAIDVYIDALLKTQQITPAPPAADDVLLRRTMLDLLGRGEDMIEPVADRPGHDRRYAIDATRISTELGWTPTRSAWPQALAETIEWYRAHEPWWRPLKANAFNATML